MLTVHLDGSFADWRRLSRQLVEQGRAPHEITWSTRAGGDDLFGSSPGPLATAPVPSPRLLIPKALPALLERAARYRSDDGWALLYRVLWRVAGGDRSAMLAGDLDGAELHRRARQVSREAHHMEAFLRFRERPETAGAPRFVAWHEPAHDVLELVTEHFMARLGRVSWLIASPDGAARSDGQRVTVLKPCPPELAALARDCSDTTDDLWRAYYASTFNPARVNAELTRQHMPARFWKNLPEGPQIAALATQARLTRPRQSQVAAAAEQPGQAVRVCAERAMPKRALPSRLDACRNCPLWQHATCAVPGEGPVDAPLMLVGEQPGDQEDLAGRPFVGPAGQLLDQLLVQTGVSRERVFVTNAVKHFKWEASTGLQIVRKHSTPNREEISACRPWLEKELADVQPHVVVALGRTALAALLGVNDPNRVSLTAFVGRPVRHDGRWIVAAPHPASILRSHGEPRARLRADLVAALTNAAALQRASVNGT